MPESATGPAHAQWVVAITVMWEGSGSHYRVSSREVMEVISGCECCWACGVEWRKEHVKAVSL